MKNLRGLSICLVIGACISACHAQQPSTPRYPDLVITMQRGPCFGTCPVYLLTIYGDGRVIYEGQYFVTVEGIRKAKLEAEQIQALVTAFEHANFFGLRDNYAAPATDLPSVDISITINGRSQKIRHYGMLTCNGELDSAPQELCDLENKIDAIVNSSQWVDPK
jgi:hypothetical protein